jgi:hypothetical protein
MDRLSGSGLPVTTPPPSDPKGRILQFRQRGSLFKRNAPQPSPVDDLAKYESAGPDAGDDYRHRMAMNGLAALVIVVLIGVGLWIADTMAEMRKNQDCVLMGRRACAPVDAPIQSR